MSQKRTSVSSGLHSAALPLASLKLLPHLPSSLCLLSGGGRVGEGGEGEGVLSELRRNSEDDINNSLSTKLANHKSRKVNQLSQGFTLECVI